MLIEDNEAVDPLSGLITMIAMVTACELDECIRVIQSDFCGEAELLLYEKVIDFCPLIDF